jgi:folate-dependent phosphoribosylglycinamide formyltransferase PurN
MNELPKRIAVVMFCGDVETSKIMYNGLRNEFDVRLVVIEDRPSIASQLVRKYRKFGFRRTFGQVLFFIFIRLLSIADEPRCRAIKTCFRLEDSEIPLDVARRVSSINDDCVVGLVKSANPCAIVVNGTRIISGDIIDRVGIPLVNVHMGITPRYRGVHGAYWALANNDIEHCGVTVHLIDQGIDTGGVLYQDQIQIDHRDTINTYPLLQIARGIQLLKRALHDIQIKRYVVKVGVQPSKLWYHPTITEYITAWIQFGVK